MKKTLIALAVLGAAGVAHAQSNVTIYGVVDAGYVKTTGEKVFMDENINNRLGFQGVEDLGGGLKATFQLEERFKSFSGKASGRGDFEGAANVGLAGNWGAVRFGRLNELSTETLRTLDPFNQFGIASMITTPLRGMDTEGRLSSTARYDSPAMNGFSAGATFTLQNNQGGVFDYTGDANNGYALSVKYMNGPLVVLGNYNKAVNSSDSMNWNLGGAYSFGPAKVSLAYEQSKLKYISDDAKAKNWLIGLTYTVGSGFVKASYNHLKAEDTGVSATDKQYALGYTYNLSKRTSLYADYARYNPDSGDDVNSYMIGMTHKF